MPPLDEQQAIVSNINDKCAKITSLISEHEAEIKYLKEYKQQIIADCMTGQVNALNKDIYNYERYENPKKNEKE